MKREGVEQVIAEHLLTDKVLDHLLAAGEPTVREDDLAWSSFPQLFGTTTGPWNGFGGAAVTTYQVTVAVDGPSRLVLVFAASDLYAHGWTDSVEFWSQCKGQSIDFDRLAGHGLTVLERRLT